MDTMRGETPPPNRPPAPARCSSGGCQPASPQETRTVRATYSAPATRADEREACVLHTGTMRTRTATLGGLWPNILHVLLTTRGGAVHGAGLDGVSARRMKPREA